MNYLTITALISLLSSACFGQVDKSTISNREKEASLKLVYQKCPDADILEIELKEDYIEIDYLCDEEPFEVGIRNKEIVYIESNVDESDIPYEKIQKKLEKEFFGWALDEISLISTTDTAFLKVEVMKDGIEQNLFFTKDGKWYRSKSIVVSDNWSLDNLSNTSLFASADYFFLSPDKVMLMPDLLREISGISLTDSNTILCVQDELGAVFEYSFNKNKVKHIFRFTDIGDFEDVAIKGDSIYVLRSDGTLFSFDSNENKNIDQKMIAKNALNYESLTYDATLNSFFLLSKDAEVDALESERTMYQFSRHLDNKPSIYLEVNVKEINDYLKLTLTKMESDDVLFNPSAIAIHPITKDVYVLSATDRILAIYKDQQLKSVYPLPAEIYFKPEGMTFYKNGDLLISSEGDKKGLVKGSIMYFKQKQ